MENTTSENSLLTAINSPHDLRRLAPEQLTDVVSELRQYIITTLNQCGGHFGANLGAVELTVALHYVFNTPDDRIVWDVGHQAYPHKVLTGRRDRLHTIKQWHGLAPFPKRAESEYDTFGVGHSSTSISAALGMAIAAQQLGLDRQAIAVIGDGGLTGGMAFEALNHAGSSDVNLLIILNDNDMSISPNVGALTHYLTRILSSKMYTSLREGSKKVLDIMPPMKNFAKRTETHLKGMVIPGTIFEELGVNYFGPIDGHDLHLLISMLQNLQKQSGPRLLHIVTTKGKGFPAAEAEQVKYHAVKPGFLDVKPSTEQAQTQTTKPAPKKQTYSQVFGQWLCDMAAQDEKLYAITPAMREGSGMVEFHERFPKQYCDVGIAEQHSVTLAAGMAIDGLKPVVAIYSTFLQRAYDQLIHDVAIQNLDVTFALDRAGLVGADGPTHAGSFDLSYCRCIPNMVVMAPADENECRQMLYTAYQYPGPATVRYPRGTGPGVPIEEKMTTLPLGVANVCREGHSIAILAFGSMVTPAIIAGERLDTTVVNMRFVKPLDEACIRQLASTHDLIVTIEENAIMGGAGSAVNEFLFAENLCVPVLNLGLPDHTIEHGDHALQLESINLHPDGIVAQIQQHLAILKETAAPG